MGYSGKRCHGSPVASGPPATTRRLLIGFVTSILLSCPPAANAQANSIRAQPRARLMAIPHDSVSFMVGGVVVSLSTGEPVVGAQVFFRGTTIGTLTGHDGRFRLDAPAAGPLQLATRVIGFNSACFNVEPAANTMLSLLVAIPEVEVDRRTDGACRDPEVYQPDG